MATVKTVASSTTPLGDKAAKLMAAPDVVHSNYVPAQLNRQLEFLEFNPGMS